MFIQMNLSEEEIRVLKYKRFREDNPFIQKNYMPYILNHGGDLKSMLL
jgi:Fe-S cluster biogenesis protein NfuA